MWNEYFLCVHCPSLQDEEPREIKNEHLMETLWLWDLALWTWNFCLSPSLLGVLVDL